MTDAPRALRASLVLAAAATLIGAGSAEAASVKLTGPPSASSNRVYEATVTVDPTNDAAVESPVLTVRIVAGTCPAGPGPTPTGLELAVRYVPASSGVTTIPISFSPLQPGTGTICAWLDADGTTLSAFASDALTVTIYAPDALKQEPSVTAAWGQTASGKCRVQGDVTPRGTGSVKLQRKSGKSWTTVKSIKINDTKYVSTFSGTKGKTYRVSYAGNVLLKPSVSLSHKVTKRTKYEC